MSFKAKKATKSQVVLRMNLQGPSGSGKTKGALRLGRTLAELVAVEKGLKPDEARLVFIDTENESALLYADEVEFDHVPFDPPYSADRYKQAIKQQVEDGYHVIIVDTLSHWWKGVLSRKEALDGAGGNSYTNWGKFTPEIEGFVEFIKNIPVHIIFCARSKTDIILQTNDRGKQVPVKVGMKPVLKEDMDYEFDLVFEIGADHRATATKDRTDLFAPKNEAVDLFDPAVAIALHEWATSGAVATVRVLSEEDRLRIFGVLKRREVSPDKLRKFLLDEFSVTDSKLIPASQVPAVIRWLESAESKAAAPPPPEEKTEPESPEEKKCREVCELIGMPTKERAILFQQFGRNWDKILKELNIRADEMQKA